MTEVQPGLDLLIEDVQGDVSVKTARGHTTREDVVGAGFRPALGRREVAPWGGRSRVDAIEAKVPGCLEQV